MSSRFVHLLLTNSHGVSSPLCGINQIGRGRLLQLLAREFKAPPDIWSAPQFIN